MEMMLDIWRKFLDKWKDDAWFVDESESVLFFP